jgi:hypothetical protein
MREPNLGGKLLLRFMTLPSKKRRRTNRKTKNYDYNSKLVSLGAPCSGILVAQKRKTFLATTFSEYRAFRILMDASLLPAEELDTLVS